MNIITQCRQQIAALGNGETPTEVVMLDNLKALAGLPDLLEELLGGNLHRIQDALGFQLRQGDNDIMLAMRDLDRAWQLCVFMSAQDISKPLAPRFQEALGLLE
jgi:hypothetical protein